jgi:predicted permease
MIGTVALLLAIGCLAGGALLLLRTEARRDELAMCLSLGASKGRLVRGVVIEGALLAGAGLVAALPASAWLVSGIRAFELPGGVQIDLSAMPVDTYALLAAGGAALLATLVVALVAGSFVISVGVATGQRPQAGATPRLARARMRTILGAGQVAISLVLLAGAALFARSIAGALTLGPGDEVRRLVTGTINPLAYGYTEEQASAFFDALRERLHEGGGIDAVSIANPYSNMLGGVTLVDGAPRQFPSFIYYQGVDEQYFPMLGLPLVAGRGFSEADRGESPAVAIVSESLGRLLAGGGTPIGRMLGPIWWRGRETGASVAGVVPDIVTNIALRSPYVIYMPEAQMPGLAPRTLFVRTAADPAMAMREVASAVRDLDPAIAPPPMQTVGERLDEQLRAQRFGMLAMGGVGVAAALLTALGVYVMAASLSVRRRRELGIRSALGAPRAHLGLIILREAGVVAGSGIVAGIAALRAGIEPVRAFLFQIEPFDPVSIGIAAALLAAVVLMVSLQPARAAMRVDVARILAEE